MPYPTDRHELIAISRSVSSIGHNRTLPLPRRACNQMPHGIGQLPEQTLRNKDRIGDDKDQVFLCAVWGV